MEYSVAMENQEQDETTAALAQSMGFSSFGSQEQSSHPYKRRKHNPNADAVVASPATGANASAVTPLTDTASTTATAAPSLGTGPDNATARNTDEIDLDESEDENGGGAGGGGHGSAALHPNAGEGTTARQSNNPALAEAQALIDQIVARNESGESAGKNEGTPHASSLLPGGPQRNSALALPKRPSPSWGQLQGSLPSTGQEGGEHGYDQSLPGAQGQSRGQGWGQGRERSQGREHGKPWWEGYYDPASNQNPWAALEKKAGLEPRGSWLSRTPHVAK